MKQLSCADCRFANPLERPTLEGSEMPDLSQPQIYQCRRYPPQFVQMITPRGITQPTPDFPKMVAEHWCGEHAPIGPAN
jgi:hypothetical protein